MICVNELSFVAQASNVYEATELMHKFAHLIGDAKLVLNERTTATHTRFYNCSIAPNFTVHDWLYAETTDQASKVILLALTKKGPFIDELIQTECDCSCRCCGNDISFSGLAGVAHFGGVAISLVRAGNMSANPVAVDLCSDGGAERNVANLSDEAHLSAFERIYRPTAKHGEHGWGTVMDLDDETAQTVLNLGIVYGRRIYSAHENSFYVFNSDSAGGFHGYPIDEQSVPQPVRDCLAQ